MEKSTMCEYPQSNHTLTHWKCVMRCCAKCPIINLTDQETDDQYTDTSPSICFHIYHLIAHCTKHGSITSNDKKNCRKWKQYSASE